MRSHPRSRRPILVALSTVLIGSMVAACGSDDDGGGGDDGGAAPSGGATVTIATFNFDPDPLEVAAGTVITFTNEDAIDHTVTAGTRETPTPEVFDGELPEKGTTFELTLDEPGTYEYFCRIHQGPGMTGVIEVS
jgi:plastocyanin